MQRTTGSASEPESAYAWVRLAAALALGTIGGVGMWSYVVALPAVQAEFGARRGVGIAALCRRSCWASASAAS